MSVVRQGHRRKIAHGLKADHSFVPLSLQLGIAS